MKQVSLAPCSWRDGEWVRVGERTKCTSLLQIFTHNMHFQTKAGMAEPKEIWHYMKFVYMLTHANGSGPLETISGSSLILLVPN